MCKLLMLTGIEKDVLAVEFVDKMAVLMSKRNSDGIGYTAVKPDGTLFSQKWLKNSLFFNTKNVMTESIAKKLKKYKDVLPAKALDVNFSETGLVDFEGVKTITLHTRFATCDISQANVHPFIENDTSLIHNGMISNSKLLALNKMSTCDSEVALHSYIESKVDKDMTQAQDWINKLAGRWAFGVLGRDSNNMRILDVVRGSSFLYYMEIDGLGRVFTTDKDDAINVAKEMNLTFLITPELIDANSMYRYDAITGNFMQEVSITDSIKNYVAPYVHPTTTTKPTRYGTFGKWVNGVYEDYEPRTEVTEISNEGNGYDVTPMEDFGPGYPDVFNLVTGEFSQVKVNRYCTEEVEIPFPERLSVWDECHDTDNEAVFWSLDSGEQMIVEANDLTDGFHEAKLIMYRLHNRKQAN